MQEISGQHMQMDDISHLWMRTISGGWTSWNGKWFFCGKKAQPLCFCSYEFGDEHAVGTGKIVRVPDQLTYQKALSRTVIFTSTVLFDREKIDKALLQMPDVPSEDTAMWWQILRNGHVAYGLKENLVIYRRPEKSLSSNKLRLQESGDFTGNRKKCR